MGQDAGMMLTLVVLAAGMGSRYGGLKQLDPMGPGGETILDYSVHDAVRAGFGRVVFVIRRDFEGEFRALVAERYAGRVQVELAFQELGDLPAGFEVPEGRVKPWGTAHAILAARRVVNGPFLAINADDFYGREAYAAMAAHLADSADFAMAGYRLAATLSDHGTVSRGVCEVDPGGWLTGVREYTAIRKADGGGAVCGGTSFSGGELVSMNFWGFTPAIFPALEEGFAEFLATGRGEGEYYIPTAVERMVAAGRARVRVIPTDSTWFGVTYREDRAGVVERLAGMVAAGEYRSPLWG